MPRSSRSSAAMLLVAVAVALATLAHPFPGYGLLEPDDARYAEIGREMALTGEAVVPALCGVPYLEKPPLSYWLTALAMRLLGVSGFAARLPSGLASVATALAAGWFARRWFSARAGFWAAVVLGTALGQVAVARLALPDPVLSALLFLSLACLAEALRAGRRAAWYAGWAAAGLAFLVKGPIGVLLPAAPVAAYQAIRRRSFGFGPRAWAGGIALALAIPAPWLAAVTRRVPIFPWFFVVDQHVLRFLGKYHGGDSSPFYYIPVLAGGLAPWTPALWAVLDTAVRGLRRGPDGGRPETPAGAGSPASPASILLVYAAFVFLFFSIAGGKLATYILPAVPPLALLIGREIATRRGPGTGERWVWRGQGALLALGAAVLLCISFVSSVRQDLPGGTFRLIGAIAALASAGSFLMTRGGPRRRAALGTFAAGLALLPAVLSGVAVLRSARPAARAIRGYLGGIGHDLPIVLYRTSDYGIPFYTGREVIFCRTNPEVELGQAITGKEVRFPDPRRLARRLAGREAILVWRPRRGGPADLGGAVELRRIHTSARLRVSVIRFPASLRGARAGREWRWLEYLRALPLGGGRAGRAAPAEGGSRCGSSSSRTTTGSTGSWRRGFGRSPTRWTWRGTGKTGSTSPCTSPMISSSWT